MKSKDLVLQALLASIYVVLTLISSPLAYGPIQFRIAETLLILVLLHPKHSIGILIGTLIANVLGSPYALDWLVGTGASALAIFFMIVLRKYRHLALWMPTLVNGPVIGWLIWFTTDGTIPFWPSALSVAFGEWVVTYVLGLLLWKPLTNNRALMEVLDS